MAKFPPASSDSGDPAQEKTFRGKIIIYTPVVLTILATVLAGISSSEMSAAQYYRSIAAQMQSKVSDQWGFFQAKRLREEQCNTTIQILQNVTHPTPLDPPSLRAAGEHLIDQMKRSIIETVDASYTATTEPTVATELTGNTDRVVYLVKELDQATTQPDGPDTIAAFFRGEVPKIQEQTIDDPAITDSIRAINSRAPEADLERQAGQIEQSSLDQAVTVANDNAAAFDNATTRAQLEISRIGAIFSEIADRTSAFGRTARWVYDQTPGNVFDKSTTSVRDIAAQLNSAFNIASLRFNAVRYDRDARYNQVLADIFEVRVRRESYLSERHRVRSKEFFYVMLGAQTGVTIATLSLAVKRRMFLWSFAVAAGFAALSFAAYVYFFV
ncbi:MAG TPA: DUF4337 family protein [Tepidisphaeraceae bacterium]|jgi:hypothetical protein